MNNNLFAQMQAAMANPAQFCQQNGLPPNAFQNPQAVIQQMMNSGRITQEQFNQVNQQMQQMRNNPQFMQMYNSLFGGR